MEELINLLQEFAFNLALLALPVISVFLIALLRAWIKKVLQDFENSKPELYWVLDQAVELAVQAAEQMELAGFIEDKKQYAFRIAQVWLDDHGWDEVSVEILDAAIEAEVLERFPK
jgi:hypothetical protein